MKAYHDYTIADESIETQHAAGRYNPAMTITYRDPDGQRRQHIRKFSACLSTATDTVMMV